MSRKISFTINWLFIFLAFITPLVFSFKTSELFEFPKMLVIYVFTSVIVGLWLARWLLEKKISWRRTPLDWPIWLFFLSQAVSTVFSIHPQTSFFGYYTRFHGGLLSTISYILLYYAFINNVSLKTINKILQASLVSGVIIAGYGILEHFGHSLSCLIVSKGQQFGVNCWVQDVKNRVFATLGQPNWFAALMDMLILFGLHFWVKSKHLRSSLAWLGVSLVLGWSLIYTGSRSGTLAVLVGLLTWFSLTGLYWSRIKSKPHNTKYTYYVIGHNIWTGLVAVALSFGVLALVIGTPLTPSLSSWLQTRTQITKTEVVEPSTTPIATPQAGGTDSGVIRTIVWQGAIKVWRRHPWIGTGPETFAYSYYLDRPEAHNHVSEWNYLYNKAHNEFLNFAANTGLFGLLSYLLLLLGFSVLALKQWHRGNQPQLMTTLLSAVIGLTVSNFFGFSTVSVSLLMWLAFAMVSRVSLDHQTQSMQSLKPKTPKPSRRQAMWLTQRSTNLPTHRQSHQLKSSRELSANQLTTWQYFGLLGLMVVELFSLSWTWRNFTADRDFKLGQVYIRNGQYQVGFQYLESAVRQRPNEALFQDELSANQAKLALVLAQQGQTTAAHQTAQTALKTSNHVLELNNRQINFYKRRAYTLALISKTYQTLTQADQVNTDQVNQAKENGQVTSTTASDDSSTVTDSEQSGQRGEQTDWARLAREALLLEQATLARARQLAPNEPSLSFDSAKVEVALDNPTAARALFEETIKLKPDYGEALYTYGEFLVKQKDYQRAKEVLEQFLTDIDSDNQTIKQLLEEVDKTLNSQS